MVYVARDAAEKLEKEGVSVEIVDLRTLLPIDEETILKSVRKTSKVIVLHEATLTGGVGAEIAARITEKAFDDLDGPIIRIAAPDTPVPYSPPLEDAFLPNVNRVLEKARWLARY
jgi:2-oxoisovalerate dehydrogenase E1 component beta subunit